MLDRQWALQASCSKTSTDEPPPADKIVELNGQPAVRDAGAKTDALAEEQSYFALNLFVAALGDGKLLSGGARKKHDVLEQVRTSSSAFLHLPCS